MKRTFLSLIVGIMAIVPAFSQLDFDASYTGDFLENTSGGIKTGFRYMGFATMGIGWDTEKNNWWDGGYFYLKGGSTHGGLATEDLIGDFQTVSNIEAGDHTYLSEFWFRQQIQKVSFSIGLQDLNADYAVAETAGNYINSSFGIHSLFASNFCSPIFPITGLGLNVKWEINDKMAWQAAIYDGGPLDWEENPYNIKWKLNKNKGYLTITEFQYTTELNGELPGCYKVGTYYHTGEEKHGFFGTFEQTLWKKEARNLQAFIQAAGTSSNVHENYLYLGGGVNLNGLFCQNRPDMLGLAVASTFLDNDQHNETSIELTYKYQLSDRFFFQPDLQYVINPAGSEENLDNAFVAMMRVGFEF